MLDKQAEESILELNIKGKRAQLIIKNATLENDFKGISKNSNIDDNAFKNLTINDIFKIDFNEKKTNDDLEILLKDQFNKAKKDIQSRREDKVNKIERGDELLPGVMKMVKVFVAMKRKLQLW